MCATCLYGSISQVPAQSAHSQLSRTSVYRADSVKKLGVGTDGIMGRGLEERGGHIADGVEGWLSSDTSGAGDRSVVGVDAGTPIGSEAACDLAKHYGCADFALGDVVCGADPPILDKDEL